MANPASSKAGFLFIVTLIPIFTESIIYANSIQEGSERLGHVRLG
jgi:hypothetical protein